MVLGGRKATALLFAGDIAVFAFSLWLTLLLRYGAVPSGALLSLHFGAFSLLFVLWAVVFYMAGLYSKRVLRSQRRLIGAILSTQLVNILCAALFFFLVPLVDIAPKTNLIIYLVVSLVLVLGWRLAAVPRLTSPNRRENAALIAAGPDAEALEREVNGNPCYPLQFCFVLDPSLAARGLDALERRLREERVSLLIVDASHNAVQPLLPLLYRLAFTERRFQFSDFYQLYEEIFDRVPLSVLRYDWFLKNISNSSFGFYALMKRAVDIVGGVLMGLLVIITTPFVYAAMRLEGPGPLFIIQERIGQHGTRIRCYKFRTMLFNYSASATWVKEEEQKPSDNRVTRVGKFLRRSSLDEFPQCINVLKGELSLVGPRNDIAGLGVRMAEVIPYYMARYSVKPGITGWAQINQRYEPGNISPQSLEETKVRLAYDFYYIKHRSLALDVLIALRTVKRMLFRVSRL